jgi:hypothetical protein
MNENDFDLAARAWLDDGPTRMSDRAVLSALEEIHTTRQRRAIWPAWRATPVSSFIRLATAAVLLVAVGLLAVNLGPRQPDGSNVGGPPTPSATADPVLSPSPSASSAELSFTSDDGEVTVSAPSTWAAWLPGKAGNGEASDVWFGMLRRVSDPWPNHSHDHIGFVDPVAYDWWCWKRSLPAGADALAQAVITDPSFETTAPVAARIGGLEAVSIDVALAPGGSVCMRQEISISRWIHVLRPESGLRLRLYLVDLPEEMSVETLAITVLAPEDSFEEVIAETAPIIESIEFHPSVRTTSPPEAP